MSHSIAPMMSLSNLADLADLMDVDYQRWLPHVDLRRKVAVHPFERYLYVHRERYQQSKLKVNSLPKWMDYITDSVSEQIILNVMLWYYCLGRVRCWQRGLCIFYLSTEDLAETVQQGHEVVSQILASLEARKLVYVGNKGGLAVDWISWRDAYLAGGGPPEGITYIRDVCPSVPKDMF